MKRDPFLKLKHSFTDLPTNDVDRIVSQCATIIATTGCIVGYYADQDSVSVEFKESDKDQARSFFKWVRKNFGSDVEPTEWIDESDRYTEEFTDQTDIYLNLK